MKIDIKDKLKTEQEMKTLPEGHRALFEKNLKKELHSKPKSNWKLFSIAASFLLLFSLGMVSYLSNGKGDSNVLSETELKSETETRSLAEISPDFKKVEDFYLTQIKYQIAKIKVTDENKDLLEVYMSQLSVLQQEYNDLNAQLNSDEFDEETIDLIIENLQIRLRLLQQLKKKLIIIENIKTQKNEQAQV